MTTYAQGSRLQVAIGKEATIGTASTTLAIFPINPGVNLALTKGSFTSDEIRADRQVSDMRHGAKQTGGAIPFTFRYADMDVLLAGALFGAWTTSTTTLTSTSIQVKAGNVLVKSTAWGANFTTYSHVDVSGFTSTNNNGVGKITALTGTTMTLSGMALTVEAAGDSVTVKPRLRCWNSNTMSGYTVEKNWTDLAIYDQFVGQRVGGMSLSMQPNAMVTGSFTFLGENATSSTTALDASPTALSGWDAFSGIDLGTIYEGGASTAIVTGVDLTLNNNLAPVYVLGTTNVKTVTAARCQVTGTLTALFTDMTMVNKFRNETETSLWVVLTDPDGNKFAIDLPRIKYSSGDPVAQGEGEFTIPMSFTALRDTLTGYTIIMSRSQ